MSVKATGNPIARVYADSVLTSEKTRTLGAKNLENLLKELNSKNTRNLGTQKVFHMTLNQL